MAKNQNNNECNERWEFIEKASKEVDSWSDSKKAEVFPRTYQMMPDDEVKAKESKSREKIDLK